MVLFESLKEMTFKYRPSKAFDAEQLMQAFRQCGDWLALRGLTAEVSVGGGSALLLQTPWRRTAADLD